jgi:hypothetical protein
MLLNTAAAIALRSDKLRLPRPPMCQTHSLSERYRLLRVTPINLAQKLKSLDSTLSMGYGRIARQSESVFCYHSTREANESERHGISTLNDDVYHIKLPEPEDKQGAETSSSDSASEARTSSFTQVGLYESFLEPLDTVSLSSYL